MNKQYELSEIQEMLDYIDPAALEYQEWLGVGMALNDAGGMAATWDAWSKSDTARYRGGECFRKWDGFRGAANPVTAGTIVQMARDGGWQPDSKSEGRALDWDDIIGGKSDLVIIDQAWIEDKEVHSPEDWDPVRQLMTYFETLFEASENVGYVTESWEKDGKYFPKKGSWSRTAGELIQALAQCKGDIGAVLGDYNPAVGAWIRFNPLDGHGIKNENVTDYRYALVESDKIDVDRQNAIIRELDLPVACMVHSGGKSLHAIVRINATSYEEYQKRVDYLYSVCKKNGLKIDTQNRNPSRLSRMPGVTRNGQKQFLVDTNIGKESWESWVEWIDSVNDDLPEPEGLESVWDDLPELAPPLIDGILRQGHKMLIAGPSKAGKSFALIGLCCAIAEGRSWMGFPCAKGRVMYVNLELDRASCLHRFKDVYQALGWAPKSISGIDIWNLRGKSVPMDKLAPKLIRRAAKKGYTAIVIDPIYKVITGDENSADQMAQFCNQFDIVCHELKAAVIYCHHHSKGTQGQKRSMDRASGSGVFARDPDALIDYIELDVTEALLKQEENKAICAELADVLVQTLGCSYDEEISQDDICSAASMENHSRKHAGDQETAQAIETAKKRVKLRSAWRIEGTLREFPRFEPVNVWFDYPIHHLDDIGSLKSLNSEGGGGVSSWEKSKDSFRKNAKEARETCNKDLENAINVCNFGDPPTVKQLADYLLLSERQVHNRIRNHPDFWYDKNGKSIKRKSEETNETE